MARTERREGAAGGSAGRPLASRRFAGSPPVPPGEAARRLGVRREPWVGAAARRLPLRFTAPFLELVDPEDPDDPLRRIAWPAPDELAPDPGGLADPVGERGRRPHRLVARKYPDRAVLLVTTRCPVYCRFCFRAPPGREPDDRELAEALRALARLAAGEEGPPVREAILSGGDPLFLADGRIAGLVGRVAAIPGIRSIRVHTRVPVVDPPRVTADLARALVRAGGGKLRWVGLHLVHPRELSPGFDRACAALREAGLALGAQVVLLRGVNDREEVLRELFGGLWERGIAAWYLHHPDRVAGAGRFRVSLAEGLRLFRALRGTLPGPALPAYVLDLPDGSGKVPVDWLVPGARPGTWRVPLPGGGAALYEDPAGTG